MIVESRGNSKLNGVYHITDFWMAGLRVAESFQYQTMKNHICTFWFKMNHSYTTLHKILAKNRQLKILALFVDILYVRMTRVNIIMFDL